MYNYRGGSMNTLAAWQTTQTRNATQWYALNNMATLFNNHPYISSSKLVPTWRATATYVGMVAE